MNSESPPQDRFPWIGPDERVFGIFGAVALLRIFLVNQSIYLFIPGLDHLVVRANPSTYWFYLALMAALTVGMRFGELVLINARKEAEEKTLKQQEQDPDSEPVRYIDPSLASYPKVICAIAFFLIALFTIPLP